MRVRYRTLQYLLYNVSFVIPNKRKKSQERKHIIKITKSYKTNDTSTRSERLNLEPTVLYIHPERRSLLSPSNCLSPPYSVSMLSQKV